MTVIRLLSLVLACGIAGCAGAPRTAGPPPADDHAVLGPGLTCAIPPASPMLVRSNADQAIVAHFRDQTFSFEAQIQSSPGAIDLVAVDALGRRGMTIKWQGGQLEATRAPWLPPLVRPADILTDIAIVYWPAEAIAPALAACGAELEDHDGVRTVRAKGRDLMTVTYGTGEGWSRSAHLHNLAFGFAIDIQSVDLGP